MSCNKYKVNRCSSNIEKAFLKIRFRSWGKCRDPFETYEGSEYHGDLVQMLKDEETYREMYDELSESYLKSKANNQKIFLQVLQSYKKSYIWTHIILHGFIKTGTRFYIMHTKIK